MATLQIGRAGVDFEITKIVQVDHDGDEVTIRGWINSTSTGSNVLRQQLLGYVSGPRFEEAVPVVASWDSKLDGFYVVLDASVDTEPTFANRSIYGFGVSLARVGNWATGGARVETYVSGVARSTSHSLTPTYWHAVPSLSTSYTAPVATTETRIGPNGSVRFYRSSEYTTETTSHYLAPGSWYTAGSYIKTGGYYVCGSQVTPTLTDWEIGNNCLKVVYTANGNIKCVAPTPASSGLSWSTATSGELKVGWWNGSAFTALTNPATNLKVVTNTPHQCAIRLTYSATVATDRTAAVFVDIAVKRGDRMASVTITSTYSTKWGLETYNSIAGTAITGGFSQTADDADANRLVVLCADALTTSLTGPSRIYLTSDGTRFRGAIGHEYNGGSSADPSRDTDLRDSWFASMTETPRLVTG